MFKSTNVVALNFTETIPPRYVLYVLYNCCGTNLIEIKNLLHQLSKSLSTAKYSTRNRIIFIRHKNTKQFEREKQKWGDLI